LFKLHPDQLPGLHVVEVSQYAITTEPSVQAPVSYSVGHIKPKLDEDQLVQPVHIVDIDDAK
jgi:hypothetical protein